MQFIIDAIGYVLSKFVALADYIGALVVAAFVAIWHVLTDIVCWAFDQLLSLAVSILSAFDFSALSSQAGAWAGLPASLIEVLQAIGLTTCLGLIVSAITIRVLLQLIPFTRLGS
ncbi:DUF2523 domain-containing protein [Aquabacterium fontiphilum]|uniref:DUF2523 family protein n=1 Tax=Aquabacterium fontiphilum TaxID=450365 RepID=UPI001377223A|nr:DUF2523 family protein [Aquabacterium fontiphilum]NBD21954.1 DUF2523 domain-containing protein [Aquabacterium fontiphilum]